MRQTSFSRSRLTRGFSLVEMLAVVTITAILAIVGVSLFRKYIGSSKGSEALYVIQAIRAAQESYQAENHTYLDTSTADGRKDWFPNLTPNQTRYAWAQPTPPTHPDGTRWLTLAPAVTRPVQFGFLVYAGASGVAMPAMVLTGAPTYSTPTDDWYLIQAEGDTDGNGVFAQYATASYAGQSAGDIWTSNEGE